MSIPAMCVSGPPGSEAGDPLSATPERGQCVLRYMLEHQAQANGARRFVQFWAADGAGEAGSGETCTGDAWTYAETLEKVRARAAVLKAAGVRQGDHVLCWMGNGPDLLTCWFAINYLGAVYVPVNTAARGRPLEHILNDADAPLLIAHRALAARLAECGPGKVTKVLLTGEGAAPPLVPGLHYEELPGFDRAWDDRLELERPIEPWDVQAIMYTSGTTGASKGVLSTYVQLYTMGPDAFDCMGPDDCCLICGPIFHCGSTLYVYAMLAHGASIGMVREFRTLEFWDAVRGTGSTVVLLLGVMATFLLKQPPHARDRDHPLKKVFIVPFSEDAAAFRDRFGVALHTVYNMTEIASPLTAGPGISEPGLAGVPRAWFDLRVADAHDRPVRRGEVGELLIRSHRPWALMKGYHNAPAATVAAMRNGWFHTGDAFREDADGRYFFVDRMKDVIRRRGENISSFELEGETLTHPKVKEAVAVAVASADTEDEVLVVVTPTAGETIDPAEIVAFLAERVAHYMVPRYVRVSDDLPKTASGKLQKHLLRTEGVTPDTFDREVAGIRLKRERLT